ncbi:MAG TPA: SDR family oxidoreductase [Devosiaceae bacterium]|nr:SDR family oxidoreductase [Devosiaceae bacterium]
MMLEKSCAVVIGGTSGIGLATARAFAAAGADAVVVGRSAERANAAIEGISGRIRAEIADAGETAALAAVFERLGQVDHLVLAASGGSGMGPVAELATESLRDGFEHKFWVHWNALKAALPSLAPSASITFVTAASSRMANPGTAGLAAINGAIDAMIRPLARELAPRRVNAVSPGVIDTPWWDGMAEPQKAAVFEALAARTAVGRVGCPEEVADAILSLAGNGYITGVILDVNGGLSL